MNILLGMAAIVAPSGEIDLSVFLDAVKKQLPSYATPIFLRLVQQLDITGTFKLKKLALQREGYNPHVIQDQMFFLDAVKGAYRQLDACLYNDIGKGYYWYLVYQMFTKRKVFFIFFSSFAA